MPVAHSIFSKFGWTDVVSKREVSLSDATGSVLVRSVHAVKNHRFVDIHGGRHSLKKSLII